MKKQVFRYAPSPTGMQHIGGLRTALYCHLMAKKTGGELILRIEDTDRSRFDPKAEEFILKSCDWLGINFTQGPHRQSERLDIYRKYALDLVRAGHAYFAFDTKEFLEKAKSNNFKYNASTRSSMRNSISIDDKDALLECFTHPYVIRLKVPFNQMVFFLDEIRGTQSCHTNEIQDTILLKSDGYPSYHLASVVDDHLMGVTHVIRGEEWISSTPIHMLLYHFFGWETPKFSHLPLMLDPNGNKFSKRSLEKFDFPIHAVGNGVKGFRESGYLPEALVNYIALLGWNPGGDKEIMSMEQMIDLFKIEDCHLSGARFDLDKLNHFQAHYMKQKDSEELHKVFCTIDKSTTQMFSKAYVMRVIDVVKDRLVLITDLTTKFGYLFEFKCPQYDQAMIDKHWKQDTVDILGRCLKDLSKIKSWNLELIDETINNFIVSNNLKASQVMPQMRIALTGGQGGPSVSEVAYCLGGDFTLHRIQQACKSIKI